MRKLYSYYRSSAAFRVRIALNYKGLNFDYIPIHLLKEGGQHFKDEYLKINPQGLVPALVDGSHVLSQSLAILEYLEEAYPKPPLLPEDLIERARVRSIAQLIACEIHPLQNLRVIKYITNNLGVNEEQKSLWIRHWIREGFIALERQLVSHPKTGDFCHGNSLTIADICLVPQFFNAKRFELALDEFPTIKRICTNCLSLEYVNNARPENQPDSEVNT